MASEFEITEQGEGEMIKELNVWAGGSVQWVQRGNAIFPINIDEDGPTRLPGLGLECHILTRTAYR